MKIGAFSIRDSVLNGAINEAEQVLRYNQGDGLTLISTQYNGLKYNVCFKDVFTGKVQLYEKVDSHYAHPVFLRQQEGHKTHVFMVPYTRLFSEWYTVIMNKHSECW